jgi:hypothetical protein
MLKRVHSLSQFLQQFGRHHHHFSPLKRPNFFKHKLKSYFKFSLVNFLQNYSLNWKFEIVNLLNTPSLTILYF